MKSTCTDLCAPQHPGGRWFAARKTAARRGTAEIETLLVIILLLLPILFVIAYAGRLGVLRLANVFAAENNAYTQIETGAGLTASMDPTPIVPPGVPALPSRFAVADQLQPMVQQWGRQSAPLDAVTLEDKAYFLDPSWHYQATPVEGDQPVLAAWFDEYVGESHPAALDFALGIQPPGPP